MSRVFAAQFKAPLILNIAILLSLCFASLALADHLPEDKLAKGKSDSVLCGVNVYKTPISEAIKKLGKPYNVSFTKGGNVYVWKKKDIKIELGTYNDKGNQSIPYSVEIWGNIAEGEIGRTGRGLKLGDTLRDVRRIYGNRFLYDKNGDGTSQIKIQWQDETELDLFFNKNGHLDDMYLMAEIE